MRQGHGLPSRHSLQPHSHIRFHKLSLRRTSSPAILQLNILQLFIQPEIVTQFMDDRQADLSTDFGLVGADRFNVLLIKHDVIGSRG